MLPIVYDGSSTLATQLIEGAPADVFASADEANMQKLVDANLATGPELFATNTLVIAMPTGNPGGVEDLSDLGDDSVTVVLCAPEVPCGAASRRQLLANAGVTVAPASLEQNVTAVLTKVAADEADAGLVYATDVRGRDDVESLVPDGAADVVNRYPIVALTGAREPGGGRGLRGVRAQPRGTAGARGARLRLAVSRGAARGFVPQILLVPAVIGLALLVLPLVTLVARVDWSTLWADITSPEAVSALLLSLGTGLATTLVCVVLGVPLALVIARSSARLAGVLRALVTVPLVLPPMVGGIALLFLFGRDELARRRAGRVGDPRSVLDDARSCSRRRSSRCRSSCSPSRGRCASTGCRLRGDRGGARCGPVDDPAPRDASARRARAHRRASSCASRARSGSSARPRCSPGMRPGVTQTMPLAIYTAFNGSGVSQGTAVALSLLLLVTAIAVLLLVRAWRPETPR